MVLVEGFIKKRLKIRRLIFIAGSGVHLISGFTPGKSSVELGIFLDSETCFSESMQLSPEILK